MFRESFTHPQEIIQFILPLTILCWGHNIFDMGKLLILTMFCSISNIFLSDHAPVFLHLHSFGSSPGLPGSNQAFCLSPAFFTLVKTDFDKSRYSSLCWCDMGSLKSFQPNVFHIRKNWACQTGRSKVEDCHSWSHF